MSTLHVICTALNRPIQLRMMIDSFIIQTCKDWTMSIVHDGVATQDMKDIISTYNDERVSFIETESVNGNYGHPNRKLMLDKAVGNKDDYILITNEDNYYVPVFVEWFLKEIKPNVGMIYCNTVHSYLQYNTLVTKVKENYIDMGSFIVRLDVAKETGFNHIHFSADGRYAVECLKTCQRKGFTAVWINKSLFCHN